MPNSLSSSDCARGTSGSVYLRVDQERSLGRCRIFLYDPVRQYSLKELEVSARISMHRTQNSDFCFRWKLSGSRPSSFRNSLYRTPNESPG